jgi:hypothetical protein
MQRESDPAHRICIAAANNILHAFHGCRGDCHRAFVEGRMLYAIIFLTVSLSNAVVTILGWRMAKNKVSALDRAVSRKSHQ